MSAGCFLNFVIKMGNFYHKNSKNDDFEPENLKIHHHMNKS